MQLLCAQEERQREDQHEAQTTWIFLVTVTRKNALTIDICAIHPAPCQRVFMPGPLSEPGSLANDRGSPHPPCGWLHSHFLRPRLAELEYISGCCPSSGLSTTGNCLVGRPTDSARLNSQ
eukprot:1627010-Amphidinium_carterae.1